MKSYVLKIIFFFLPCLNILMTGCVINKHKDIAYLSAKNSDSSNPKLSIYTPKKVGKDSLLPVLIFVHGGNWNSGKKETYGFIGRNFSKKGVVTIVPGYTLSPNADYDQMTSEIATAILWVKNNISSYGGDPNKIFLTGHSAGGHLITLATVDTSYNIPKGTISGIILNDAAGLDMYTFLKRNKPSTKNNYLTTWTNNPETWKKASPLYHVKEPMPPFLIYLGKKTYPSITSSNKRFIRAIKPYQPEIKPIVLDKKHVGMITQYIWSKSKRYTEIIDFMKVHSKK